MGIAKHMFDGIMDEIFTAGRVVRLYKTLPDEETEEGGELLTHDSVADYMITADDFTVADGTVTSNRTMMLYLYEGETTTCEGFGVFKKNSTYDPETEKTSYTFDLLYFGGFNTPLELDYNDVPAIKKYNSEKGEGIKITMVGTTAVATTA